MTWFGTMNLLIKACILNYPSFDRTEKLLLTEPEFQMV